MVIIVNYFSSNRRNIKMKVYKKNTRKLIKKKAILPIKRIKNRQKVNPEKK